MNTTTQPGPLEVRLSDQLGLAPERTYTRAQLLAAIEAERHACSIAVWMTKMDATDEDADDLGVAGWLEEAEQRVKRRGVKAPCGECHLQPGERCDVCGASSGA